MDAARSAGAAVGPIERLNPARTRQSKSEPGAALRPLAEEHGEVLRRNRALKQISLACIAPDLLHHIQLFEFFNTLSHGAQFEVARHGHDGAAQGAHVKRLVNAAN